LNKSLVLLLSFLYLVFSTGFTLKVHYCGDKLQSVTIFAVPDGCKKCGKKGKKDCCKDFSKTFQVSDDHSISHSKISFSSFSITTKAVFSDAYQFDLTSPFLATQCIGYIAQFSLADSSTPVYLRICSLLI